MGKKIIFSGVDATGKTTRANILAEEGYCLSVLMKEIDIYKLSIKQNIDRAIDQGLNNNKIVMDRSLIDLLVYYYINDKKGFLDKDSGIGNIYGVKIILEKFIYNNQGGTFNYLEASSETIIERLLNREKQGEKLSENDLKVINQDGYLEEFIITFNIILNIFEKINKKMGNLIEIKRIDTTV